jgi:hypothetical protein
MGRSATSKRIENAKMPKQQSSYSGRCTMEIPAAERSSLFGIIERQGNN